MIVGHDKFDAVRDARRRLRGLDDDYPLAPAQRQAPRASQEVLPPIRHGQPDWRAWARKLRLLTGQLTIIEVHWLRTDNRPHLDAYERAHPGAGRGGPAVWYAYSNKT